MAIDYLVRYLEAQWARDDDFPWNKLTCLAIVCYVIKKKNVSSHTFSNLERAAVQYTMEGSSMQRISELFANSFIPEARIHFTVPKLNDLSDKDKSLKGNEILAVFLDFLVQILHRERIGNTPVKHWDVPLAKELLFLIAVLGDKPFDCNNLHGGLQEQVKDIMTESEALANEAGGLIYSCVFSSHLIEDDKLNADTSSLLEKFKILQINIKQHCFKFSKLPIHDVPRSNVVDSFFIIYSLIDDLDDFLLHKYSPMKGQIVMLRDELRTSKAVLEFMEARQSDSVIRESLDQIRDLAYEAEYLISSHVVGTLGIKLWYLDLRLASITKNIKFARERLEQINELQPIQVMIHNGEEISDVIPATAEDDNYFVELKQNMTVKILDNLVGKPKSPRQTISIVGMSGLGKTTIANKLYRCSSASDYFHRRVWCVVSQTYSERSLLINISIQVAGKLKKEEILKKSDLDLRQYIYQNLIGRRYLIVLDDVWDSNAWNDLETYFPKDLTGSRVILTSRIKDVAPVCSIYHTLPLFSADQCWDLLEKKTFRGKSYPPELVKIGKRIAAKCFGIPLAVVVTAGILADLNRDEDAWEKQLDVFLSDSQSDYKKRLELSYEHLPHNIKPCFLYFAAFPEDAEISVNNLAWRWIAEGFIRKNEGKSQEQIAELYLLELMNRNLVIPGKRGSDGRITKFRIHDLLLDICVKKANEENFLNSNNELSLYAKHQRSYLSYMSVTDHRPFGLHCRSLVGGLPDRFSFFQTRPLLKVLDIRPNKFENLYGGSGNLPIQLRYLGVDHLTDIMVANLDNLEVINVVNPSQVKVPSIVLRMKKLRHLIVKKEAIFDDGVCISDTTNLRTLLYVCIYKKSDEMILRYSPRLQKLKINVSDKTISLDLSFLKELETLEINNIFGRKLSNLNFPSTLKNLCLHNTRLLWKNMSVIGRLPHLCVLKLEHDAFLGKKWETSDDEFKELRFLKISQNRLKHWMSRQKHFPELKRLVIEYCVELQEIPSELGDISTLQKIDVTRCSMRVSLSAIQIEKEQRETYGNEEFQVNITTKYWTKQELVALCPQRIENANDCKDMYELISLICSPERDFVVNKDGEQVKVNSLKGKIVGIFFSDVRLESCRLFTQKLVRVYNELKKHGHFEIVFVSVDNDVNDELFNANFSKFPWVAIPLSDSYTRNKLDELFDVQTIPHLVILDKNGEVLTEEGVRIVEEDSKEEYPFGPECSTNIKQLKEEENEDKWSDSLESLLVSTARDYVIDNDKKEFQVSSFVGKTTLLLFMNDLKNDAVRRMLIPKLIQAYQKINERYNNSLEVIFISLTNNQYTFDEFFATTPWLALPCGDDRIQTLIRLYKVKTYPTVVVIGPTGIFLTKDGCNIILLHGAEAYPFTSERLKEIEDEYDNRAKLWLRMVVREDVHEHKLALVKFTSIDYHCDTCGTLGYKWAYYCKVCEFAFHPKCVLGNDYKAEMAESLSKGVELEEGGEVMRNYFLESSLLSKSRDYVINSAGTKIPVYNLVGKTTMLFFAGGLRQRNNRFFVSKLVQVYKEINEKYNDSVEVIFISDDKDQGTFEEFFTMMPWLALPFNDNRKESLARLYKVKSVPNVVVIGPTGKTLTFEGYKLIICHGAKAYPFTSERVKEIESENDIVSNLWPKVVSKEVHEHKLSLVKRTVGYICDGCDELGWDWSYYCENCDFDVHPKCALDDDNKVEEKRNVSLESLLFSNSGDYVVDAAGTEIRESNLVGKIIILFFAAQWCPPCRFVLPELLQKYQENNEKHNNCVEVIFISRDKDRSSFDEFYAMMPWLALPFGDDRITVLSRLFKVMAIPMLVTIEPTGKTTTGKPWELISYPGQDAYPFTYEWVQSQVKAQQMVIFWPKKVTIKLHEHELCLVKQIIYDCDGCQEAGFDWSYKCEVCTFSLHPNCALRDDKSEAKGELEDEEEKTESGCKE